MTYALYEDPGIRGIGAAIFRLETKELVRAAYVQSPCRKGNTAEACRAAVLALGRWVLNVESPFEPRRLGVEWPQMYQPGKQKGDQNDLPPLAGIGAGVAILFPRAEVISPRPREWKGTLDPDVLIERVRGRLTSEELARVEWLGGKDLKKNAVMHNVFDAIGIGLHDLGRLALKRPYSIASE